MPIAALSSMQSRWPVEPAPADHELVAVRRSLRDPRRAHHAAGATDILDDDLLAQNLGEAPSDDASEHVGAAAGSERTDHGQRPAWPALCCGRMNAGEPTEDDGR